MEDAHFYRHSDVLSSDLDLGEIDGCRVELPICVAVDGAAAGAAPAANSAAAAAVSPAFSSGKGDCLIILML